MRMNMAGERGSEASDFGAGGASGTHLSQSSALKESEISSRFAGSSAVPSKRPTGMPAIGGEPEGKDSFSRAATLFEEAGIAAKSNKSSIVSSEGQDGILDPTKARLPSVFAGGVGEL